MYVTVDNILGADDAVSSVISVVLMVAIVVILGAVVSVFALGIGESVDSTVPSANFEFEYESSGGEVTVTHSNGDSLSGSQVRFAGAATEQTSFGGTDWGTGEISAGDSATVKVDRGETLRVVWQADDGSGQTATLGEYEVPDEGLIHSISGIITGGDIQPDGNGLTVDVSSDIEQLQGGSAEARIFTDGTLYTTTTISGSGEQTLLSSSQTLYNTDYEVRAYETSNYNNEVGRFGPDKEPSSATIGGITGDINGGPWMNSDGKVSVSLSSIKSNDNGVGDDGGDVYVVVDDDDDLDQGGAEGDAGEAKGYVSETDTYVSFTFSGGDSDQANDHIYSDETMTVKIYDNESHYDNNPGSPLDTGTKKADEGGADFTRP
ncbi:type IV pilin N-terminal domain-containing protein [Haloarcula regularis]|uniref:type IV pilin N-terminal domain-containing protein n=1 Tax=Haloarcula regularis TaxID=3033392 RepID=UPI0023E8A919|nr:type IV pilin N-terminal domain-containing protein [Halomicroarcula sp. SYNS111]